MKKPLPLDDPGWVVIDTALAERSKQTGSPHLAARDLTRELRKEKGGIRSKLRRWRTEPQRGVGPPAPEETLLSGVFWHDHELDSWSDRLFVVPSPRKGRQVQSLDNCVCYVWGPDYRKIFHLAAAAIKPDRQALPTKKRDSKGKDKNEVRRPTLQWQMAEAIIKRRYPDGVPDNVQTETVRREIASEWGAECRARELATTSVHAPSWRTVNRMLKRE